MTQSPRSTLPLRPCRRCLCANRGGGELHTPYCTMPPAMGHATMAMTVIISPLSRCLLWRGRMKMRKTTMAKRRCTLPPAMALPPLSRRSSRRGRMWNAKDKDDETPLHFEFIRPLWRCPRCFGAHRGGGGLGRGLREKYRQSGGAVPALHLSISECAEAKIALPPARKRRIDPPAFYYGAGECVPFVECAALIGFECGGEPVRLSRAECGTDGADAPGDCGRQRRCTDCSPSYTRRLFRPLQLRRSSRRGRTGAIAKAPNVGETPVAPGRSAAVLRGDVGLRCSSACSSPGFECGGEPVRLPAPNVGASGGYAPGDCEAYSARLVAADCLRRSCYAATLSAALVANAPRRRF